MKKKNIFFVFLILIFAGLLFYLVYKRIGTEKIWQSLLSFSPIGILVVFLMMSISHIIGILRWQIILKDKGYHFNFKELILPWFVNFGITFFAPFAFAAAETMRASIIKERNNKIRWKKILSSVFIDKLFEGTTSLLMIFFGILSLIFYSVNFSFKMWLFFLFLMIPILGVGYFYFKAFNSQRITKFIEKPLKKIFNHKAESIFQIEEEIFNFLDKNNKNFKEAFFLAILRQFFDFLACFFILFFMGANLSILQSIAVIGFIYISFYIIPVPAAIGILEIVQTVIFNHFGFAPQLGVAFSLLYRAFFFIFAFLGIVFSFRVILRWVGNSISEMVKKNNNKKHD